MHELLVTICSWMEKTSVGGWVRESLWGYPFVQLIHFSGLSLWVGTNVAVDLRLMGLGRQQETAAELSESLFVWNWIGFCIVVLGGLLLFSATATLFIVNLAFEYKLGLLVPLALVWHIIVQRKTRVWGRTPDVPLVAKLAGLIELVLWLCVITAAVEIPNY